MNTCYKLANITDAAEHLGMYAVNEYDLYQQAKIVIASVAELARSGVHNPVTENFLWRTHCIIAARKLRKECADVRPFHADDLIGAAVYCADHYRDELRDVHGVELPPMQLDRALPGVPKGTPTAFATAMANAIS